MGIRTKIIGCFTVVVALFGVVCAFHYVSTDERKDQLTLINEVLFPLSRRVTQFQEKVAVYVENQKKYPLRQDNTGNPFSGVARDLYPLLLKDKLEEMHALVNREHALRGHRIELHNKVQRLEKSLQSLLAAKTESQLNQRFKTLSQQTSQLTKLVSNSATGIANEVQRDVDKNLALAIVLSLFVTLMGFVVVLFSNRSLRPLPILIRSLKRIADGDLNQSIKINTRGNDEITKLAREYNRMLASLRARTKELEKKQEKLLESERLSAIGQLSAEIVHEIRNPLNSISLNIDWLEGEMDKADAEVKKTLNSISREVERLNQITESYLLKARVPSHKRELVDLHSVIDEVVEFSMEGKRSKISVHRNYSEQTMLVNADRSRLKQAFLNVIKNAVEAMPRGGDLGIQTRIAQNTTQVMISDTGHGMSLSTQRKSFNPFYTTKPNGTGLGLIITREILEESQGNLRCESVLGQGSTFIMQFPVVSV